MFWCRAVVSNSLMLLSAHQMILTFDFICGTSLLEMDCLMLLRYSIASCEPCILLNALEVFYCQLWVMYSAQCSRGILLQVVSLVFCSMLSRYSIASCESCILLNALKVFYCKLWVMYSAQCTRGILLPVVSHVFCSILSRYSIASCELCYTLFDSRLMFYFTVPQELSDRIILRIICIFHYARIIVQCAHNCISL